MATVAKEDKLAQLKKLLGELSHEQVRQAIVECEAKLDTEDDEDTEKDKKPKEEVFTLEDFTKDFPVAEEAVVE